MTNPTMSAVVIELRTPMQDDQSRQSVDESNTANNLEGANDNQTEEIAVDGGYGWICVICVFLINAHTWGFNSAYGVFLAYYLSSNTFPGASRLEFAFIGGFAVSVALTVSPLATYCNGKLGTRLTLLCGVVFQAFAFLGASFTKDIWQLFLSQGICFGFGTGFLSVGSIGIIPQWFDRHLSLANGLATAGSGIGGIVYSLATNAMITHIGLSWAFRVLALVALVVNGACAWFIRDRSKATHTVYDAFNSKLLKNTDFLWLLAFGWFSYPSYVILLFSLPDYGRSIGLSSQQASLVSAVMNLGQAVGRPAFGFLSDSFGRVNIAFAGTLLAGILSLSVWVFASNFSVLLVFAILVGTVSGTFWATIGPITAEVLGIRVLPSALSVLWIILAVPTIFAEPIGLKLSGNDGSTYLASQLFTGALYLVSSGCIWAVGRRLRKNK